MPPQQYLSTDPNAGRSAAPAPTEASPYLSTDPNAGVTPTPAPSRTQPTILDRVITTGARVLPAIAGGAAAGLLAIPSGPGAVLAAAAGGAAGAGVGETAAEWYEKQRGIRTEMNPTQIATQAALGAVPVVGKAGGVLKTVASRAGQGAVLGGVADAATSLAEGEMPTWSGAARGAAFGAAIGGPAGALESKLMSRAAARNVASQKYLSTDPKAGVITAAQDAAETEAFKRGAFMRRKTDQVRDGGRGQSPSLPFSELPPPAPIQDRGPSPLPTTRAELVAHIEQMKSAPTEIRGVPIEPQYIAAKNARIERAEAALAAMDAAPIPQRRSTDVDNVAPKVDNPAPVQESAPSITNEQTRRLDNAELDLPRAEKPLLERLLVETEGSLDPPRANVEAPPTVTDEDPFRRLAAKQNAPDAPEPVVSKIKGALGEARRHFVNRFASAEKWLKEGGVNPLTEDAATNPIKQLELATGGASGRVEAAAIRMREVVDEAEKAGLSDPLQELLNLNALEAGADTLSRRAGKEAAEDILEKAPRAMARDAEQPWLIEPPKVETPKTDGEGVSIKMPKASVLTADLPRKTTDGPHSVTVGARTSRTDRFRVVPLEKKKRGEMTGPASPEVTGGGGSSAADELDELDDEVDDVVEAVAPKAEGADWKVPPQSDAPPVAEGKQPRQPALAGMPTETEIAAINARIDRAKLAYAQTYTKPTPSGRLDPEAVERLAAETAVPVEHVKAFAKAAADKGGLPEWYVKREILDAKRRGWDVIEKAEKGEPIPSHWDADLHGGKPLPAGAEGPLEAGKALPEGITPAVLAEKRAQWEARTDLTPDEKAVVQRLADQVTESNRKTLEEVIDAGLITPEVAKELRERAARAFVTKKGAYSPLSRIMDELETTIRGAGPNLDMPTQHVLAQLNGSTRTTQNPLLSSLSKQATALQEAARNRALQSFVALRNRNDFFKGSIIPIKEGAPLPKGTGFITVFEAGKPQRYAVPDVLAEALKGGDAPTTNLLIKALQVSGSIFRTGTTTANAAFAIPNVLRDVSDLALMSGKSRVAGALNPKVWAAWGKAFKDVVTDHPDYLAFLDSGAAFSTFQKNVTGLRQQLNIGLNKTTPMQFAGKVFRSPLTLAESFNNALEEATKLSAFRTFSKEGGSAAEAAWKTRRFGGSPDFARRGASTGALNTIVPFLNAQIQGLDRIAAFAKANPKNALIGAASATGLLASLQMYNNSFRDPDGTRSWDRITDREKQQNWVILLPGTFTDAETGAERSNYAKIPAGHTVNLIRGPLQALLDPASRNVVDLANSVLAHAPTSPQIDPEGVGTGLVKGAVSAANPALRVPIEQAMNLDTFRNTPIVSRRLETVAPEEQFTDTTSLTAKRLGKAVGSSPQRIEHAARGFGGGVADMMLSAADSVTKDGTVRKPVTEIPGLKQATETPVLGGVARPIVRRFVGGPASVDASGHEKKERFYSTLREATEAASTLRLLRSRGDRAVVEKFLESPRNRALSGMAGRLNTIAQRIAAQRRGKDFKGEKQVIDAIDQVLSDLEGVR